jgi:branched-chain amino acid transport system substrate-binding protein
VAIDVPAASGPTGTLDPPVFKNAGMTLDVVPVPPGTADMTPKCRPSWASTLMSSRCKGM